MEVDVTFLFTGNVSEQIPGLLQTFSDTPTRCSFTDYHIESQLPRDGKRRIRIKGGRETGTVRNNLRSWDRGTLAIHYVSQEYPYDRPTYTARKDLYTICAKSCLTLTLSLWKSQDMRPLLRLLKCKGLVRGTSAASVAIMMTSVPLHWVPVRAIIFHRKREKATSSLKIGKTADIFALWFRCTYLYIKNGLLLHSWNLILECQNISVIRYLVKY